MKRLIQRIKIFWSMYLSLLMVFGMSYIYIVDKGIENKYLMYAIIVAVALILIAICVLTVILSEENYGYKALFIINSICKKLWKVLLVIFLVIYKLHKEYGYGKSQWFCKYCGQEFSSLSNLNSGSCPAHPNGPHRGKHAAKSGL